MATVRYRYIVNDVEAVTLPGSPARENRWSRAGVSRFRCLKFQALVLATIFDGENSRTSRCVIRKRPFSGYFCAHAQQSVWRRSVRGAPICAYACDRKSK